jgi:nucleoside-diphosphate-sugar epimerase
MAAKALITGATGLLGTHVVDNWDLPGVELVNAEREVYDLLQPGVPTELVQRYKPQTVIHLAWVASGTHDYRTSPDNQKWVEATRELESACLSIGAWFIATGTLLDETTSATDAYSYAKAKLRVLLDEAISSRVITWLRPHYVIDLERQRPSLIAEALRARSSNSCLSLRSPESQHDFIVASDVGRAIVEVVRHGLRGVVQIGSGELRKVQDLVAVLGVPWIQDTDSVDFAAQSEEAADIERLREIGWSPLRTDEFFGG